MFYQIMWGINVKTTHNCSSLPDKKHRISLREHKSRPDSSLKDTNTDHRNQDAVGAYIWALMY